MSTWQLTVSLSKYFPEMIVFIWVVITAYLEIQKDLFLVESHLKELKTVSAKRISKE